MATGNVYGVQKMDEPEVRNGLDIAMSSSSLAAQGAKAGSAFGPWGTAAGAVAGLGMGVVGGMQGQRKEEEALAGAEAHNEFVENLEGREGRTTTNVRAQAKYGMKANNKYETAEIEGDGSGSVEGIGEIHVDKNYNIKNIAKGARRHEDGGFKIDDLAEDDIIFPTQNSTKEYNRTMAAIKRWKLNGDQKAKKYLDGKAKQLPTDADYGYDEKGKYSAGRGDKEMSSRDRLREMSLKEDMGLTRRQIRMMSDEDADATIAKYTNGKGKNSTSNDPWDKLFNKSETWDPATLQQYVQDNNLNYDDISNEASKRGINIPAGSLGVGSTNTAGNWGPMTAKFFSKDPNAPATATNTNATNANANTTAPTTTVDDTQVERRYSQADVDNDELWNDINTIEEYNNPLKYASSLNKGAMSLKDTDKVERRFVTPEEVEYEDRSATQRRTTAEQRNFETQRLRGKGLSAGQVQAYGNQIGSRYLRANEAINEREAARQDGIDASNVGVRNQAELTNLNLANKYDMEDDQADAAKQKYRDEFYSDVSKHAMVDEQGKYMRSKNRKQNKVAQATARMLGTTEFGFDPNNPLNGVQFKNYKKTK